MNRSGEDSESIPVWLRDLHLFSRPDKELAQALPPEPTKQKQPNQNCNLGRNHQPHKSFELVFEWNSKHIRKGLFGCRVTKSDDDEDCGGPLEHKRSNEENETQYMSPATDGF